MSIFSGWMPISNLSFTDSTWVHQIKRAFVGDTMVWPDISKGWVYYNPSLWFISASYDGIDWITISDKNLWATTVFNSGDTLTAANCGNYFQRWNNYAFPFNDAANISAAYNYPWEDVTWYDWNNNYNSSTCHCGDRYGHVNYQGVDYSWVWFIPPTTDLWWDSLSVTWRQGPCLSGWHIPQKAELVTLQNICDYFYVDIHSALHFPIHSTSRTPCYSVEYDYRSGAEAYRQAYAMSYLTWTTTQTRSGNDMTVYVGRDSWRGELNANYMCTIRPFKNVAVVPDETREPIGRTTYWWHDVNWFTWYRLPRWCSRWNGNMRSSWEEITLSYDWTANWLSRLYTKPSDAPLWEYTNRLLGVGYYRYIGGVSFWVKMGTAPTQWDPVILCPTYSPYVWLCRQWENSWEYDCLIYLDSDSNFHYTPPLWLQANTRYHIVYYTSGADIIYWINGVKNTYSTWISLASSDSDILFRNDPWVSIYLSDVAEAYNSNSDFWWDSKITRYWNDTKWLFGY